MFSPLHTNNVIGSPPLHLFVVYGWGLGGMKRKGSGAHIMAWIETTKCMGHLVLLVWFSSIGNNGFCTYGLFFHFSMCIRLDAFIISTIFYELHLWMNYTHIHCVHTIMTIYTMNFISWFFMMIYHQCCNAYGVYYHQDLIVGLGSRVEMWFGILQHIIDFHHLQGYPCACT